MHLWAEIMRSVLDSLPGYTALGPADLGAVYPGALLAHRALCGPECTHIVHYLSTMAPPHSIV